MSKLISFVLVFMLNSFAVAGADIAPIEEPMAVSSIGEEGDIAPVEEPEVVFPETVEDIGVVAPVIVPDIEEVEPIEEPEIVVPEVVLSKAELIFQKSVEAYKLGYFQSSIELVLETIKIDELAQDKNIELTAKYYMVLVLLYIKHKEYSLGIEYSKKFLNVIKSSQMENNDIMSMPYYTLGICYRELMEAEKAKVYFKKATSHYKDIENEMKDILSKIYR